MDGDVIFSALDPLDRQPIDKVVIASPSYSRQQGNPGG
jgi:hypothetical protein